MVRSTHMPVMPAASGAPAKPIDSVLMSAQNEGHRNTHDAAQISRACLQIGIRALGAINRAIETSFVFNSFSFGTIKYKTTLIKDHQA